MHMDTSLFLQLNIQRIHERKYDSKRFKNGRKRSGAPWRLKARVLDAKQHGGRHDAREHQPLERTVPHGGNARPPHDRRARQHAAHDPVPERVPPAVNHATGWLRPARGGPEGTG